MPEAIITTTNAETFAKELKKLCETHKVKSFVFLGEENTNSVIFYKDHLSFNKSELVERVFNAIQSLFNHSRMTPGMTRKI